MEEFDTEDGASNPANDERAPVEVTLWPDDENERKIRAIGNYLNVVVFLPTCYGSVFVILLYISEPWNNRETRFIFNMYEENKDQIGPNKHYRNKKALWHYIATELFEVLGVIRSWEQVSNRFKTVIRKRRLNVVKILNSSPTPTTIVEEPIDQDPIAPTVVSSPANVKVAKILKTTASEPLAEPAAQSTDWQSKVAETIRNTLLDIDNRRAARETRKEKSRERRHNAIIELLKSMQRDNS